MDYYHTLLSQRRVRLVLDERVVVLELIRGELHLSTKIFDACGFVPQEISDCIAAATLLKWEEKIAFKEEDGNILFTQVRVGLILPKDIDLALRLFVALAGEWEDIIASVLVRELV